MMPRSGWWGVSVEGGANGETGDGWEKFWKYVCQRCFALFLKVFCCITDTKK